MKGARGGPVRGGGNPGARPHLCRYTRIGQGPDSAQSARSQAGREKRVSDPADTGSEPPPLQGFSTGMGGGQEGG